MVFIIIKTENCFLWKLWYFNFFMMNTYFLFDEYNVKEQHLFEI